MRIQCGGLTFFSNFDSGNLAKVELVPVGFSELSLSTTFLCLPSLALNLGHSSSHPDTRHEKDSSYGSLLHSQLQNVDPKILSEIELEPSPDLYSVKEFSTRGELPLFGTMVDAMHRESFNPCGNIRKDSLVPDRLEFNVWTRKDCEGTPFENENRTWFYFGVEGGVPKQPIRISVMNLNQQTKLMSQGMAPVYRILPGKENWERILSKPSYKSQAGNFVVSFDHEMPSEPGCQIYFAFTYPFSYTACQKMLDSLDRNLPNGLCADGCANEEDLYYSRELLCRSLCGRRVDLLTVTSHKFMLREREVGLPNLFPDASQQRSHRFHGKKVVFISSRIHPGETQSSLIFNGLLHFLLLREDPRARRLRDIFIFKLIPMLNPDGVAMGNYRTDSLGVNMNRVYLSATAQTCPPVYASRSLMMYYHYEYSPARTARNLDPSKILNLLDVSDRKMRKSSSSRRNSFTLGYEKASETNCRRARSEDGRNSSLFIAQNLDDTRKKQLRGKLTWEENDLVTKQTVQLSPEESGLAVFVDLHGHASKRGCFLFGNYFKDLEDRVESMLLSKLMSLNCPHFDFGACNFSYQNMYNKGSKDGLSKEGSARVAIYLQTGIVHSYTLECNFNTGRSVNVLPPLEEQKGNLVLRSWPRKVPKYAPKIFEEIGISLAISILDMTGQNPMSRLRNSAYGDVDGVRRWLGCYVRDRKVRGFVPSGRRNSWTGALDSEAQNKIKRKPSFGNNLHLPSSVPLSPLRPSSSVSFNGSTWNEGCLAETPCYKRHLQVVSPFSKPSGPNFARKQVVTVRVPLPVVVPPVRESQKKTDPVTHGTHSLRIVDATRASTVIHRLRKQRTVVSPSKKLETPQFSVQGETCRRGQRLPLVNTRRRSPRTVGRKE